jgi:hypothetical protein
LRTSPYPLRKKRLPSGKSVAFESRVLSHQERIAIVTDVGAGCDGREWRALTRRADADGAGVWS